MGYFYLTSRYHVSCELLYEEERLVQQTKAGNSITVKALSFRTEVIQVCEPLCPRAQVATEAEGLHTKALGVVLPGAQEFHHQEL